MTLATISGLALVSNASLSGMIGFSGNIVQYRTLSTSRCDTHEPSKRERTVVVGAVRAEAAPRAAARRPNPNPVFRFGLSSGELPVLDAVDFGEGGGVVVRFVK